MSIVDRYRILERLGNQSVRKFGEVFLVEAKADQSKAVMKAIRKVPKTETICTRLRHEASFSFDHPGLPTVLETIETNTELLVVRNYVEGIPLDQYWSQLKKKEQLPFLVAFLQKLAVLFQEIHSQGVVHCDIKPGNLLIESIEGDFQLSLIDFGLALRKDDMENREILFPLGFAAPELLLNQLDIVDHRTDIYALGVLIWRLFTGKLPLTHPNPSIFTNLQLTHPLPEHSVIPKKVFPILSKMCKKHSFNQPPNRMPTEEVRTFLIQARNQRYNGITEILEDFIPASKRRSGLFG